MIGKDDPKDEVTLKVTDRRKFNADGTLREGAEIVAESFSAPQREVEIPSSLASGSVGDKEDAPEGFTDIEDLEDADIPGAEDPASFINFLSTIVSQAAASLGAMPHPGTGQRTVDLETGRYFIEVIAMLKEKTKGNLHEKEAKILDGLLSDLRMQYVMLARASEEKLKKQAAQKFSAGDILGKK